MDYLRHWLGGTTCQRHKLCILLENPTYIVMKHFSHTEYINRFSGSATCESYARLYRKADIDHENRRGWGSIMHNTPHLKEWTGRIAVLRVIDECRDMGIEFQRKPK